MDAVFREAERIWRVEPTWENYQRYANQCARSGVDPECYSCTTDPKVVCNECEEGTCETHSILCSDSDCDSYSCKNCVEKCPNCGDGICEGYHNTTCESCNVEFCVSCTAYCERCNSLLCHSDHGLHEVHGEHLCPGCREYATNPNICDCCGIDLSQDILH